MHRFIICIASLLSTLTLYFAQGNKKNLAPLQLRELISACKTKKISKMEDRLHVHWTRAKQWPNNRQYLIPFGMHGHLKYDKDRGWQSVDVNRCVRPQGRGQSPYYLFLKTERNSGYKWNFSGLVAGQETTLSHIHHRLFLKPHFWKQIFTWLNITKIIFLQFYIEIGQLLFHMWLSPCRTQTWPAQLKVRNKRSEFSQNERMELTIFIHL